MNARAYYYEGMDYQASDFEVTRPYIYLQQLSTLFKRAHEFLKIASGIQRERKQLAALDEHLLQDIGITNVQAKLESQRSLFDIPASRAG